MKLRSLAIAACSLTAATTFAASNVPASTQKATFTPAQKNAIHVIIHSYLVKHPEVLVEASQALQAKQAQQQQSQAMRAIAANKQQLFNDPNSPTAGNPNGDVYLVEFFDYQCGHCKEVYKSVKDIMAKDSNVKFIFKELPIFGGASKFAAKAALAANKEGKYLELHDKLFETKDMLTQAKVRAYITSINLDVDKLTREMQDPKYEANIRANFALAQKLGIMGTPAFVISNKAETKFQFIPGATSEQGLQAAIQAVQK